MTRPAGRGSEGFGKSCGACRVGSGGIRNLMVRVESGSEVFKCHGSGGVGSGLVTLEKPSSSPKVDVIIGPER